jgi:hypothetical protein
MVHSVRGILTDTEEVTSRTRNRPLWALPAPLQGCRAGAPDLNPDYFTTYGRRDLRDAGSHSAQPVIADKDEVYRTASCLGA